MCQVFYSTQIFPKADPCVTCSWTWMEESRGEQRAISISRAEVRGSRFFGRKAPSALPEKNSVNISNDALKGDFDVIYVV